jgi:hypothetical protein
VLQGTATHYFLGRVQYNGAETRDGLGLFGQIAHINPEVMSLPEASSTGGMDVTGIGDEQVCNRRSEDRGQGAVMSSSRKQSKGI